MTKNTPQPTTSGRPLPAALALGFTGAGTLCLLLRELLLAYCGNEAALGAALAVLPLAMALGATFPRRFFPGRDAADLLGPALGFLGVSLPLSLLLPRLFRPGTILDAGIALSPLAVGCAAVGAFLPLGLGLGYGLALAGAVGDRLEDRAKASRLPIALAGAATVGALFVQFVAIPKLIPLNASLDMGLACCVAGLLCAVSAPSGRKAETGLSLLALAFVLSLPLSGIVEEQLAAWQWQCPVEAVPAIPSAAGSIMGAGPWGLSTALAFAALCVAVVGATSSRNPLPVLPGDTPRRLAAGMAESGAFFALLLVYQGVTGNLFPHLPALAAAWMSGETLAVRPRHDRPAASLTPDVHVLCGAALGLGLLAALLAF